MKKTLLLITALIANNAVAQTDFADDYEFISVAKCSTLAQMHSIVNKTEIANSFATQFSALASKEKVNIDPLRVNKYMKLVEEDVSQYIMELVNEVEVNSGIALSERVLRLAFDDYNCKPYFFSMIDKLIEDFDTEMSTKKIREVRENMFERYLTVPTE
ncbi:hypothetical protein [Alteromonas sp. P256]|uniref:hypothetical protein n=1 Tax=Alteromonas sp. P256 TaxID=3117399 RepID=UPI002FDF7255